MINIVLSASQQRNNLCVMGDTEADHCQLIVDKVASVLKQMSDQVNVLAIGQQSGDDIPALRKVVNLSNIFIQENGGKGYHLDVHTDAGAYATGASAFYASEAGKAFVLPIFKSISSLTPWEDVGIKARPELLVLRDTTAIAGLLEVSFHDNKKEAEWIHKNIDRIAEAIARGIMTALDIPVKELSFLQCIDIVKNEGIINSPYTWMTNAVLGGTVKGEYANQLIRNMANYIIKNKKG